MTPDEAVNQEQAPASVERQIIREALKLINENPGSDADFVQAVQLHFRDTTAITELDARSILETGMKDMHETKEPED